MRESGVVDPKLLVPPFAFAGKELGAVAAIDRQFARAVGGNVRAARQLWGRSTVWSSRMPPPLVAAVWRLLSHELVEGLSSLAVIMAGAGAAASLGASEAAIRGCARRQDPPADLLRIRLIWVAPTDQSAAWCTCVEIRACDRMLTGVARGAVEVEGVARSRRLGSAQPCHGTECTRVAVGPMHALTSIMDSK